MEGQRRGCRLKKEIDRKLLAALRAREPQGLEEAIGRYSPYVAGVLRKVLGQLGTQEDLEELSSDVFVALWQSAEGLREDSDLKLWLGVVARNRALKHLRALRLELPLEELPAPLGEGDCLRRDAGGRWQPAPEETKRRREALFRRARALGKQSP